MINPGELKELDKLEQALAQLAGPFRNDPGPMIRYPELGKTLLKLVHFNGRLFVQLLEMNTRTEPALKTSKTWRARKILWKRSMSDTTLHQLLNHVEEENFQIKSDTGTPEIYSRFIDALTFMNDKLAGLYFIDKSVYKQVPDFSIDLLGRLKGTEWLRVARLMNELQLNNIRAME